MRLKRAQAPLEESIVSDDEKSYLSEESIKKFTFELPKLDR